jgi:HEAT repeat protein
VLAVTALGESGNPAARELLERALRDPDANIAAAAADALSALGDVDAVPALSRAAEAGEFWVRMASIVTLGTLRDRRAVEVLVRLLGEPVLSDAAVRALGEIADPAALAALRPLVAPGHPVARTARRAAQRILASHPDVAPPGWLRDALKGQEDALEAAMERDGDEVAAHLLGIAGTADAARRLVAALDSPRADVAAAALAALPSATALAVLLPALERGSARARAALLAALPPLRSAEQIDAVVPFLADESEAVQAAAIELLGRSEPTEVLPRLLPVLEEPRSRYGAVRVLGLVGDERCEPLASLLADDEPRVRVAAAEGLRRCASPDVRRQIVLALQREDEHSVRRALLGAMGTAGGAEAVRELEPFLADPDPVLRFAALHAMGCTGAAEALPPLLWALEAEEPEFRAAALQALGTLGDPRGAAPVAEHLRADDRDVRLTAALALRDLATPAVADALLRALEDPMWSVRLAGVRAVNSIGLHGARPRLQHLSSTDPDPLVREAAAAAVAQLDLAVDQGGRR